MSSYQLNIKNMVCNRCIKVVNEELSQLGHHIEHIELGEVVLKSTPSNKELQEIDRVLNENGFELLDDRKSQLIDKVKTLIIRQIHHGDLTENKFNYSELLSKEIGYDYSYLSNLFSSTLGYTIEHYIIDQKIEKVKELLTYKELTLNEIAYQLGYSSVQHLSSQFKKVTGLTPSQLKKSNQKDRKPLDEV